MEMLKDEVKRGWQLPLPKEAALELPLIEVAPLAMVSQTTIEADGAKKRRNSDLHTISRLMHLGE